MSRCIVPPCIEPGLGCHSSIRFYADVTVVGYSSLPFDMLFSISRRSPSYGRAECCMKTISYIFSVATSLDFSISSELLVSHVMSELFLIVSTDIIVPSSNQIPHSFCFATCTLLKNSSRYLSGVPFL